MRDITRNDACPCGSGQKFKKCCGPALTGDLWPPTPEALMRSRYSAYVTGNTAHLCRTTHPDNEAVRGVEPDRFHRDTLAYCRRVEFVRLTVHQAWPADAEGIAKVLFTAEYRVGAKTDSFTELSDFVAPEGRWLYLRGSSKD